jgi:aspartate/methionine/tyrosine aminotransferase
VDEEIAFRFLEERKTHLARIQETIRFHFEILKNWMSSQKDLEWIEPSGGVVCFPRIRKDRAVDVDRFYRIMNEKYKTFVGPGHWFEMDRRYMRIGYGWPKTDERRRAAQWRKCRRLVNTIAAPTASIASTTCVSRTDPPGWITAAMPASSA